MGRKSFVALASLSFSMALFAPSGASAVEDAAACAMPQEVVYAASFKGESAIGKMRLVIGHNASSALTASIWAQENGQSTCQATCRVKSAEAENPFQSRALHLECRSTQLSALSSSMTVLWALPGSTATFPQIRFGTWIRGYQHAPLLVEVDRYAAATVEGRKLAEAR